MTTQDLLKVPPGIGKLIAIQDVSCDLKVSLGIAGLLEASLQEPLKRQRHQGGLEFVDRHTTIDRPFFETQGVMISSIDILPTELRGYFFLYHVEIIAGRRGGDLADSAQKENH